MSEYITEWVSHNIEDPFVREEIVRCRDCKHGYEVTWPAVSKTPSDYLDCTGPLVETWDYYNDQPKDNPVPPYGFCAWGERKKPMTKLKPCPFCGDEAAMSELKPCPFCGGEAAIYEEIPGGYIVQCHDCCGQIGIMTKERVIAAWNTRAERTCHIEYPYYGDAPIINGQPRCSGCKTELAVGTFSNYCPYCGAKVVNE